MKLTVVGCSPAWPNPGGAQSGYLVEDGGRSLLLDCGPGVLSRLRTNDAWPTPEAIAISHFHLDHWGDLVPWVWGSIYLNGPARKATPELWVPPGGRAALAHFGSLLGSADMFEQVFELTEYAPDTPFAAAGFTVTAARVPHYSIEAYALRVVANGHTLAYSADSGPAPALVSLARDADLFLCEATLRSGADDGEPRGHLSIDEARAAFEESGAAKLLLTHRPAELPSPPGLEFARDGLVRSF
jgi:ribonuclease BN (tRNA processing enzyme)